MEEETFYRMTAEGCILHVWVRPGARNDGVAGVKCDAKNQAWLQIGVRGIAEDGKANDALVVFLASLLDIRQKAITITHGKTNRQKRLLLSGDVAALAVKLAAIKK